MVFMVLAICLAALTGRDNDPVHSQTKATADTGGQTTQKQASWYRRPPTAGDYQEVVVFPDMERPSNLMDSLPAKRDLGALCQLQTKVYDDLEAKYTQALKNLDAQRLDELDPEVLQLPRLYQKLGDLASLRGDMDASIKNLEKSYRLVNDNFDLLPKAKEIKLLLEEQLGVANLRLGELQNCQFDHNAEMCLFPLSTRGQHKLTAGSERAIEYFRKYLETDPNNLEVRWLLNIAYMTLGRYPKDVPKEQLISPKLFESGEDIGKFTDIASQAGISVVGNAGGTVADDFDNDGFFDLMMSGADPCEPLHYYHNNGDGSFADWTARAQLDTQVGGLNVTQTDYNNDGRLDLFVMRGGWDYPMRNSLLRNNGDDTFTDVTVASGLDSGAFRTHSATWADFDNDGYLDLFIGHELDPSQLFRNKGDGTFEEVSHAAGVDKTAFTKGAVWGDYDNDGYPDIYVSNFAGENFLYHNNQNGTFTDVAKELHVENPIMSFPCWFFDYDNDGLLDIFVASFMPSVTEVVRGFLKLPAQAETMRLYRNLGKDGFRDVTKEVRLDRVIPSMGANFGDLDNDGFLDFYLGTGSPSYGALVPNFMFRNHDGKYFTDVTTSTATGHLQKGHGVAFSDMDNDGDQDVCVNIGGAAPGDKYNKALFLNPGQGNNSLSIKLTGVKSNRAAVGAKIKVIIEDGKGKESLRYREVNGGGSFGASSFTQTIGLGKAARIKSLEVYWPASKTRQVFQNLAVNQFIEVKEFARAYVVRKMKTFTFKVDGPSPAHRHVND
jgi:tetratricopeptide (TPR) repeat protein